MPALGHYTLLLIWSFIMPQPLIPRRTLIDNPVASGDGALIGSTLAALAGVTVLMMTAHNGRA
jgi:hypothetical protein